MILVKNKGKYPVSIGAVLCFPGESVFNLKYEDIIKIVKISTVEIIDLTGKHVVITDPKPEEKVDVVPPATAPVLEIKKPEVIKEEAITASVPTNETVKVEEKIDDSQIKAPIKKNTFKTKKL